MSNIKATETAPAIILSVGEIDAMRNAGGQGVTGHVSMTKLLLTYGLERLVSRDSELTTMLKVASYEGAMRDGCAVDVDTAKALLTKSASTHKTAKPDDKRTLEQDRVYSLAKYNWSVACDAIGLAKQETGRGFGKGASDKHPDADTPDAPITVDAFHVPHGLDTEGAINLFAKFHDAMRRALISDKIKGDAGSKLRQCVDDVAAYLSDAQTALETTDKPILTQEQVLANMKAKIIAELAAEAKIKRQERILAKTAKAA